MRGISARALRSSMLVAALLAAAAAGSIVFFARQSFVYATGDISITPLLGPYSRGIGVMFITLFDDATPGALPYGSQRVYLNPEPKAGTFYRFTLTEDNLQRMPAAVAGMDRPRRLRIKARLDIAGSGGADKPGDLTGEVRNVALGSRDVHLVIERRVSS